MPLYLLSLRITPQENARINIAPIYIALGEVRREVLDPLWVRRYRDRELEVEPAHQQLVDRHVLEREPLNLARHIARDEVVRVLIGLKKMLLYTIAHVPLYLTPICMMPLYEVPL